MTENTVTVSDLIHRSTQVFDRLQHERRLVVTRGGQVVGTLHAPDPDEVQLDQWVADREAPEDWRERQKGLREWLRKAPVRSAAAGEPIGSAAIRADRDETDR
ncbi:MAG: hypothetical protein ACRDQ7_00490 [Haloechinothrix sp.]